jgi:hypothetical protein
MLPHAARTALGGLRIDGYPLICRRPRRPNLHGDAQFPGKQLGGVLDPAAGAVAADDEAMRREHAQRFLDHCNLQRYANPRDFLY